MLLSQGILRLNLFRLSFGRGLASEKEEKC